MLVRNSIALFLAAASAVSACAQTPPVAAPTAVSAPLREIHVGGLKSLPDPQVVALTGLQTGAQVGKDDLQAAADKLVQSGLFAKVKYNFQSRIDGLLVTFHVEEAPRIPAYFDNLPWFADSELNDAIRAKLPFYAGALPEAGAVVDVAADVLHIAGVDFSDPALNSSPTVRQQLPELLGKPYSRMAIDTFLTEQIRPIFLQKGFLRAKLGPPEVRLTGNPNKKLPEQIPVFVPVNPGAVYHWKGVEWSGNEVLSSITLTKSVGLKSGDVADGMAIEAGWDGVREEYGRRGYMQARVDPEASYDDAAHTIA